MDTKNTEQVNLGTEIFVPVNDRSIKVCKLGLLDYAKMSGILRELIASIIEIFQEKSMMVGSANAAPEQQVFVVADLVSSLVEKNITTVINFVDLCVPALGREYIEQSVGLYDLVLLVDAILKVNKINQAMDEGKKLITNYMRSKEA